MAKVRLMEKYKCPACQEELRFIYNEGSQGRLTTPWPMLLYLPVSY